MAKEEEVVIKVNIDSGEVAKKLGDAQKRIELLKSTQKMLSDELKEGTITSEEYGKAISRSKQEMEKAQREVKSYTAMLQMQDLAQIDANATLDEQRQLLNAAQKAYASMTPEQKAAAGGAKKLEESIKALSDSVKKQEAALGDNRRNVGNYTESIIDAEKQLGGFGGGLTALITPIKGVTTGLKAMAATPIIAIISLLVTLIMKLAERFKQNAAAMEKLTVVFGTFEGIGNMVNVLIDKIAEGVAWLAEKLLGLAEKWGLINEQMKEGQAIAKEDLAIQKAQQEAALKTAEDQKKIAELKAKAAEKDKYTNKERLAMMEEALKLEGGISKRQYELAKREYELQVKKNAQSESSMDDLKKENDLKIAMINAETALFNKQKELNGQLAELRKQVAQGQAITIAGNDDEIKSLQALQAQRDLMLKRTRTQLENQIADLEAARAKELAIDGTTAEEKLAINSYYDAEIQRLREEDAQKAAEAEAAKIEAIRQVREEFGLEPEKSQEVQELEALQAAREADIISQEEYEQLKTATAKRYAAERALIADKEIRKNTIETAQAYATGLTALQGLLGTLGNAFEELGEDSEDGKKASRAFAWVSLLTSQAIAVSNTVSAITKAIENAQQSAGATGPAAVFTAPAFIAEMVAITAGAAASAVSGIIQAKNLISQSQGFAAGGIVGGDSYTGDRLVARLNSGEMVLNKDSQQRLYEAVSGKGDGSLGINYDLMAQSLAAMPAPVVVYKELEEFGDKVATYNEISSI